MFTRLSNSWQLLKASAKVLREDKELIVFPLVSFLASIVVMATFAVPLLLSGIIDRMANDRTSSGDGPLGLIMGFLFYFVLYTVVIFCNTALVGAVMMRLRGEAPTLKAGFGVARQRIGSILGYAAISATVGMILRTIAERGGIVGRIVAGLIGFTWGVATYLVVPVLVVENVDPVQAIKRSAALLKQTWGEQIVGNFGLGAITGLIFFAVILLVIVPLMALVITLKSVALIITVVALSVLLLVAMGLISSALQGIYIASVYHYATAGNAGGLLSDEIVQGAFRQK